MKLRTTRGFSLVETLVVMAIISILMAIFLPTLVKVLRKAKEVAAKEAIRQHAIGRMADGANVAGPQKATPKGRAEAREAFRQTLDIGKGDSSIVSEMLYVVKSDAEFRAYYHTLLDPANTDPLVFTNGGNLNAFDEDNDVYILPPAEILAGRHGTYPQAWEYISTDLTDTSSGSIGGTVLYSDGHTVFVRYPKEFPMTPTVAELSHAFVENQ